MKELIQTQEQLKKEALERPDAIWLSLAPGKQEINETTIVDWSDINEIGGDFGNFKAVIVVGIPLYGDGDDTLMDATRYVFNQIEIFEKTKENKKLFQRIA